MTGLACTVDTEISELVALTANAAQEVGLEGAPSYAAALPFAPHPRIAKGVLGGTSEGWCRGCRL